MGILMIFALVAALAFINVLIVRLFQRRGAGRGWWTTLIITWITGAALGIYSGFVFEYRPTPSLRVFGAPIPAAVFHWEGPPGKEEWVDFVTPAPHLFAMSNVVILGLFTACPVGPLFWLWRRAPVGSEGT
ncbi:hypothetical protein [Singulisphaera acidiphila]|uniref:Uncharacterized protein n=1 Tax=Singulisphaera acidiphila (strain ATCC BAA-1392 / DSM 18658 / VKM B-2454 / MOB10) TaxID=886293 RepID=L0DPJ7_SINAD|nr:hypothetical protein [Singulisphaera acidiphila]AGA31294.1 hypothetical protein Sinac_7248 [Singulisphaera acidiphila DSM 18658]